MAEGKRQVKKGLHFQVVLHDDRDYILEHRDFHWGQINLMTEYMRNNCTRADVQTIKITRWNEKGEKE